MGVEILVPLGFFAMVVAIVVGRPLATAYAQRMESRPKEIAPSGDVVARLERIEQAVEAMATEVERIAEGQRFTTKLLSESRNNHPALGAPAQQSAQPAPPPAQPALSEGTVLVESARRS